MVSYGHPEASDDKRNKLWTGVDLGIQEAVGKTDAGTFYFRRAEMVKAINNRQSKDNIFRS